MNITSKDIKDKIDELFDNSPEGCTGVGYGFKEKNGKLTKEKSIIYTFEKKKPPLELSSEEIVPNYIIINGSEIPTDVREGVNHFLGYEACPSSFYRWSDNTELNPEGVITPDQQGMIRPLKGGLQITNQDTWFTGTMGFIAIDNDTYSLVGVTNNHVMNEIVFDAATENRKIYDIYHDHMGQPQFDVGDRVGRTKRYVPLYDISRGIDNYVDAAIFYINEEQIDFNESYKYEGLSFTEPAVFATTEEIDSLLDSDYNLYSVGRTTGAKGEGDTKLKVLSIHNNISVGYFIDVLIDLPSITLTRKSATIKDCIAYVASATTTTQGNTCYYSSNSGDSGSAVLANINGTLKIIGILFAGTDLGYPDDYSRISYACRIDKVAEILNISPFTGQTDVNFTNEINRQVETVAGSSPLSAITINGNKYYQMGTYIPE